MALLRRRKPGPADDPPQSRTSANERPGRDASTPAEWVPPEVAFAPRTSAGEAEPSAWIPEGVAGRPESPPRSPVDTREPVTAPVEPPAAPAKDEQDMRAEVESLERQIAAAEDQVAEARAHRTGDTPTAAEAEASAALVQLQGAVVDIRARLERQTGAQRETIQSLESRVAAFEERLRHPAGYRPPAARLAVLLRILFSIALFVAIAGAPLFMSRRDICHVHTKRDTHWALVKPFDANGPPHCKSELGGTVVLHSLGLK
jgi:hypothetical protein